MGILLQRLLGQFWLIPALSVLCALLLAEGCLRMDASTTPLEWTRWLWQGSSPEGARTLLSTIASGILALAGVTFSVTIAALSFTSNTMGPRLLENFTEDRANQLTLGVFLGTFAHALWVLRTVQSSEVRPFMPFVGTAVAILMVLTCLGFLIFFIHHVSHSIRISHVIHLLSKDLKASLQAHSSETPFPVSQLPELPVVLKSPHSGYLQAIQEKKLLQRSAEARAVVQLQVKPGAFVLQGQVLASADREVELEGALVFGVRRTVWQDPEERMRQLVEVALRALSPGINDVFTALACIDQLALALAGLQGRQLVTRTLQGKSHGKVVMLPLTPAGLLNTAFHMLRQAAGGQVAVLIRLLEVLSELGELLTDPEWQEELKRHARLVLQAAEAQVEQPADLQDIFKRHQMD